MTVIYKNPKQYLKKGMFDLKSLLKRYMRVLQVSRKPSKDEFISSGKICALGMAIIGAIGFIVFLIFIFLGL